MSPLKAIDTEYDGHLYRSRLEARWAVFFDTLDIPFEYELEGYDLGEAGWCLPDFWLPKQRTFLEVSPRVFGDETPVGGGVAGVCRPGSALHLQDIVDVERIVRVAARVGGYVS